MMRCAGPRPMSACTKSNSIPCDRSTPAASSPCPRRCNTRCRRARTTAWTGHRHSGRRPAHQGGRAGESRASSAMLSRSQPAAPRPPPPPKRARLPLPLPIITLAPGCSRCPGLHARRFWDADGNAQTFDDPEAIDHAARAVQCTVCHGAPSLAARSTPGSHPPTKPAAAAARAAAHPPLPAACSLAARTSSSSRCTPWSTRRLGDDLLPPPPTPPRRRPQPSCKPPGAPPCPSSTPMNCSTRPPCAMHSIRHAKKRWGLAWRPTVVAPGTFEKPAGTAWRGAVQPAWSAPPTSSAQRWQHQRQQRAAPAALESSASSKQPQRQRSSHPEQRQRQPRPQSPAPPPHPPRARRR
jgi:hypothetical protein